MAGQQMLAVVASWDLYLATRSALVLGNVGLVQIAPVLLFTFAAGHLADRYDRRRIAMFMQASVGAVSVILALAGEQNRGVPLIYSCLFLIATARAFQWPATTAMLPQTLPLENLTSAVSWSGGLREMATFLGPAIAGALLGFAGSESVYLGQAVCAVIGAFCFWRMRLPRRPPEDHPEPGLKATVEGLRFVWRDKLILSAMSLDMLAVLFGGATALLPIYADEILRVGPEGLGWLRAAPAVGAGLMSVYLAHRSSIEAAGKWLLINVALFGVATIGFAVSTDAHLSFLMLFLTGAFDAVSVVLRISLVQIRTPDALRGRVAAVNALFISSSNQWGAVEAGVAADLMGTVPSVIFGGAMTLVVVAAIAYWSRSLRQWRN
jgi:MFS family permease